MKMMCGRTLSVLLAVATQSAVDGAKVTPMEKVLTMMNEMKSNGVADMKKEAVMFSTFGQWCADTKRTKTEAIDQSNREIDDLGAAIEKATADIDDLADRIAELQEDIGRWETDKKAATNVRGQEKTDYDATKAEYDATIDATNRALNVFHNLPEDTAQGLLQLAKAPKTPDSVRRALTAFIQAPEGLAVQAPEANAYEAQSGGIEGMIKDLRSRFTEERTALEKEEINARANYETIMQTMRDQIRLADQEESQKTKRKAQRKADKAQAEGDLAETTRVRDEDDKYRSETEAMCAMKSEDFDSRQKLRSGELEALDKAIEIISGLQEPARGAGGSAFVQLRAGRSTNADLKKALDLLHQSATKTGSKVLDLAYQQAKKASTGEDPFAKVSDMIKKLIIKLMEEANSEAQHKGWCDTELATNKLTRTHKYEEVDSLMTDIEGLEALIARLAQETEELTQGITDLQKAMSEADIQRAEESVNNKRVAAEAGDGATAVAQALGVLRDFYAKAAEATAFSQMQQTPADDAPETFDSSFKGQQGNAGGVVSMLEVVESDFARLQSDTESAEVVAAANHKVFTQESQHDMAVKNAELEHKTNKKEDKELVLQSTKSTLDKTQTELDASLAYYDKLKPTCIDSESSYEDRVARRKEEIQSLKESYQILAGEELPNLEDMKADQQGGASTKDERAR